MADYNTVLEVNATDFNLVQYGTRVHAGGNSVVLFEKAFSGTARPIVVPTIEYRDGVFDPVGNAAFAVIVAVEANYFTYNIITHTGAVNQGGTTIIHWVAMGNED